MTTPQLIALDVVSLGNALAARIVMRNSVDNAFLAFVVCAIFAIVSCFCSFALLSRLDNHYKRRDNPKS